MSILQKLDDEIWFGKYKGATVRDVAEENPKYLIWLQENTDKTSFDLLTRTFIEECARENNDVFEDFFY